MATVIFSHVKITCYFHMWRYQVFARKLTWYFIGVYMNSEGLGYGWERWGKACGTFFLKKSLSRYTRNIPDWLVDFDSSCQHSEVHYVDWKCDALAMRFHISSSWCVVKWFKINNTVNGEYHPRKQEKTFWGRIPLLESRALKIHHLLTFNELVCFTSLQESLLHWIGKADCFCPKAGCQNIYLDFII